MSALLELEFNEPWGPSRAGRILRWRKVQPHQPLGLRVRLEERFGESVEVEFPAFTGAEAVIARLEQVWADFHARVPPPVKPAQRGKGNRQQATRAA